MDTTKTPTARMSQLLFLAPLLFASAITSQEAVAPIKPPVVLETVGPDGWRARLGPTNVGVMLSSMAGRSLWQPLLNPMFGWWNRMIGDEDAASAASKRIMDYGGAIRIALLPNNNGMPSIAAVLEGDGRSDLNAIATSLKQVLERGVVEGEWQDQILAGKTVRVLSNGNEMVSEPMVEGSRLVIISGDHENIAQAMGLATHLTNRPTTISKPKPGSPALQISFNLAELISLADDEAIERALGIDDLDQLNIALRSAGPKIELDFSVSLKGTPRGIVAGFMPDSQGISSLRQLLPEDTSVWKVGRFDCHAIYNGIAEALLADSFIGRQDLRDQMNEEVGFDFGGELLANMTDELLVVGSPLDDFDHLGETTWMIAFRVRPNQDISSNLKKTIDALKPFASTAGTVDIDGIQLRRHSNMAGYDIWTAAGNGVVLLAAGRDAEEAAKALLEKAGTLKLHLPQAQPQQIDELARYLPPGLNGLARADIYSFLELSTEWWIDGLRPLDLLFDFDGWTNATDAAEVKLAQVRKLVEDHNLTFARSATGFADKRWHWRLYW